MQSLFDSKSTLEKWWYPWRDTGSYAALPIHSGPQRKLQGAESIIRAEVKKHPDVTLAELCERVQEASLDIGYLREDEREKKGTQVPFLD